MADFDAFESSQNAEADPAADFLAREQDELAGLEDGNFNDPQPAQNGLDAFGDEGQVAPVENEEQSNVANGLGDFEIIGDMSEGGVPNQDLSSAAFDAVNGPTNAYAAIAQQDTIRAEPEKIRIWREEQKAKLEKKDEEEDKKKNELRDIAKKELDDWYRHHQEQLEKTKENNRAAESAFVKERDETIPGQAWEKITKLCEFNPKNSKTTKDVSRLRSILLQLKQTPLVR